MSSTTQQGSLVTIPILDVPATDEPGVASALAEPARLALLLDAGRRAYSPIGVRFADARSRMWAANSKSPYAGAVAQVDRVVHRAGAFRLNYSYEWGCTSAAADDRAAGGTTLWRTLDWPFDGLGRALVAVRQQGRAGRYISVTWPGFVGVLTGLAPGRFAERSTNRRCRCPAGARSSAGSRRDGSSVNPTHCRRAICCDLPSTRAPASQWQWH